MRAEGVLELAVVEVEVPEPATDEVVLRVEAAPIHPSDLGLLLGPADPQTARRSDDGTVLLDVPAEMRRRHRRPDRHVAAHRERGRGRRRRRRYVGGGPGAARTHRGRAGGAMYSQFRPAKAAECLVLPDDVTPAQGAGSFVNPMTVLGMVGTMRLDGETALVHTAAASNLGQMLVRHCVAEEVPLVNVVRRPEQVELLRGIGATYVCDSSAPTFAPRCSTRWWRTNATVVFDAIGGGLTAKVLRAMEAVQSRTQAGMSGYGSLVLKRPTSTGALDRSPIVLPPRHRHDVERQWMAAQALPQPGQARRDPANARAGGGGDHDDVRHELRGRAVARRGPRARGHRRVHPARHRREVPRQSDQIVGSAGDGEEDLGDRVGLGHHHVVAGVDEEDAAGLTCRGQALGVVLGERGRRHDVGLGDRPHRRLVLELERLQVGLPRMRREPRRGPGDLVGIGEPVRRQRPGAREQDQLDAVDDPQRVADGLDAAAEVEERLAVHWRDGVEEHEVTDAVDRPGRRRR